MPEQQNNQTEEICSQLAASLLGRRAVRQALQRRLSRAQWPRATPAGKRPVPGSGPRRTGWPGHTRGHTASPAELSNLVPDVDMEQVQAEVDGRVNGQHSHDGALRGEGVHHGVREVTRPARP